MATFQKFFFNFTVACFLLSCLAGMSAKADALVEEFQGLRLNAELRLAKGKSLEDGVVLMIPSPLGHHRMELIVNVQDVLMQSGINTLAPSLSLKKDNRRWYINCAQEIRFTAENIFAEIDFWVDWLRQRGVRNITLLGHSLSANYVTLYMSRSAPVVNRAIVLAPATLAYGELGIKRYESRFKVTLKDVLARADRYIAAGKGAEPMAEKTDYYFCPQTTVTADAFVSLYRYVFSQDLPTLWGRMTKPALLVIGTNDKRSPEIVPEAKRAKESGNIEVVTIENGGHFFKGLYTDNAVEAMVRFISRNQ